MSKGKSSISYNLTEEQEEFCNSLTNMISHSKPECDATLLQPTRHDDETNFRMLPIPPNSLVSDFVIPPPKSQIPKRKPIRLPKIIPDLPYHGIPELEEEFKSPACKRIQELAKSRRKNASLPEAPPPEKKQRLLTDDQVKLPANVLRKKMRAFQAQAAAAELEAGGKKPIHIRLEELRKQVSDSAAASLWGKRWMEKNLARMP